jgi:uncharacterized protein (TIGR02147 family)
MNSIFQYTSYRTFLRDYYKEKKSGEGFTYRDFSKIAGMNSSSWLLHLIKGTKNLSNESILKVSKALGLPASEAEYFELLVHFTQAKDNDTKDYFYRKMLACKKSLNMSRISEEQYDYYTKWYHPVVRSLVSKVEFHNDYVLLAARLVPRITAAEAKKSVALLVKLGLIKKDYSGKWMQADPILSTGDEVMSLNIVNYHKQVSRLAENAFDRSSRDERDISALTLGVSSEAFNRIKARLQSFRKEIMEIAKESDNPDRVFQLNLQFFPVSRQEESSDENQS